jgi:hypothetical protein
MTITITLSLNTELPSESKTLINTMITAFDSKTYVGSRIVDESNSNTPNTAYAVNDPVFFNQIYQFLALVEGKKNTKYKDTAGKITIGVGFNMDQFGPISAVNDRNDDLGMIFSSLSPALDWQKVYAGTQSLTTESQIKELFRITLTGRMSDGTLILPNENIGSKLQKRLALNTDQNAIALSNHLFLGSQLAMLTSLAYNNPTLIGNGLALAIRSGNDQDVKKEVLENSNRKVNNQKRVAGVNGIANRRLNEAALWMLDTSVTLPNSEFWKIMGWARYSVAQGYHPSIDDTPGRDPSEDPGRVDPKESLTITINGPAPDAADVSQSSGAKDLTDSSKGGSRAWNHKDAQAQGAVSTAINIPAQGVKAAKKIVLGSGKGETITIAPAQAQSKSRFRVMDVESTADIYVDTGNGNNTVRITVPGNAEVYGGKDHDYIETFDGDDVIEPGAGNDVSNGGKGRNHYHFNENGEFGNDTVIDTGPRNGFLYFNALPLTGKAESVMLENAPAGSAFMLRRDDDTLWLLTRRNAAGMSDVRGEHLKISELGDNDNSVTVQDFTDGDFGISLSGRERFMLTDRTSAINMCTLSNGKMVLTNVKSKPEVPYITLGGYGDVYGLIYDPVTKKIGAEFPIKLFEMLPPGNSSYTLGTINVGICPTKEGGFAVGMGMNYYPHGEYFAGKPSYNIMIFDQNAEFLREKSIATLDRVNRIAMVLQTDGQIRLVYAALREVYTNTLGSASITPSPATQIGYDFQTITLRALSSGRVVIAGVDDYQFANGTYINPRTDVIVMANDNTMLRRFSLRGKNVHVGPELTDGHFIMSSRVISGNIAQQNTSLQLYNNEGFFVDDISTQPGGFGAVIAGPDNSFILSTVAFEYNNTDKNYINNTKSYMQLYNAEGKQGNPYEIVARGLHGTLAFAMLPDNQIFSVDVTNANSPLFGSLTPLSLLQGFQQTTTTTLVADSADPAPRLTSTAGTSVMIAAKKPTIFTIAPNADAITTIIGLGQGRVDFSQFPGVDFDRLQVTVPGVSGVRHLLQAEAPIAEQHMTGFGQNQTVIVRNMPPLGRWNVRVANQPDVPPPSVSSTAMNIPGGPGSGVTLPPQEAPSSSGVFLPPAPVLGTREVAGIATGVTVAILAVSALVLYYVNPRARLAMKALGSRIAGLFAGKEEAAVPELTVAKTADNMPTADSKVVEMPPLRVVTFHMPQGDAENRVTRLDEIRISKAHSRSNSFSQNYRDEGKQPEGAVVAQGGRG